VVLGEMDKGGREWVSFGGSGDGGTTMVWQVWVVIVDRRGGEC